MHFSMLEKFGAAALICAWLVYGTNFLGNLLVNVEEHGSSMAVAHAPAAEEETAAAPVETDLGTLLVAATPEQGERVFNKCKACHSIEQGGPDKIGPNMWNVVGGPKAHIDGFAYSGALAAMHDQKWTYENLDAFLKNPKEYVPGTKMTFAGLKDPAERAQVIRYLVAYTPNPPPFPEPKPTAPQAAAAPAEAQVAVQTPAEPGTPSPAQMPAAASATPAEAPAAAPAAAANPVELVAAADPAAGEKVYGRCKTCHTIEKGGKNGIGPNMWGIVGAKKAHLDNFKYSDAIATMGGTWTVENLYAFLENPKAYAPGTRMAFAGLRNSADRANVIAYLKTQSDTPPTQ